MDCRDIQEIIITDYIDGQLDQQHKRCLEEHLAHCRNCKEFSIIASEGVFRPFINVVKQKPPEIIWDHIREALLVEKPRKTDFIAEIWERLKPMGYFPKPVFALAGVVTLIFMIGIMPQLMINNSAVKIDEQGQMEYLSYLMGTGRDVSDSVNWGTPIEKYFL